MHVLTVGLQEFTNGEENLEGTSLLCVADQTCFKLSEIPVHVGSERRH
jgi:hypothetical protein